MSDVGYERPIQIKDNWAREFKMGRAGSMSDPSAVDADDPVQPPIGQELVEGMRKIGCCALK
jgi:hypothetical protein